MMYKIIAIFVFCISLTTAVELTFELPDKERECFYESIEAGEQATVDFQVIDGGNYDVDAALESPNGQVLFRVLKKQSDTYTFKAELSGIYSLCFSNEFSTFTHKLVYFDFEVDKGSTLAGIDANAPHLTKLDSSSVNIYERLNTIVDYQTHHRLMESKGRKYAEDLNERVMYWSIAETIVIIIIGIGQIMALKSFFNEKK